MREKFLYGLGIAALLLLARDIYVIARFPPEAAQGAIFKIIFFHVPAAMTGMVAGTVAMVMSVMFLITKNFKYDAAAVAVTEVGLAFLAANLVTGSLWGRVIWGIWWTWDARLT
jgi:heme exporter protein C